MQVNKISNNTTSFNAKIVNTKDMKACLEYMEKHKNPPVGWHNTTNELILFGFIKEAFEKHPSPVEIYPFITYVGGGFGERGVLTSKEVGFTDTEPGRDDSWAPLENVFRRILDPENKDCFNILVGKGYESSYQPWWDKYISPIWDDIQITFREVTYFTDNRDKKFNKEFRSQFCFPKYKMMSEHHENPLTKPVEQGFWSKVKSFLGLN